MADVTRLLEIAQAGQPQAAAELLSLVYDELRKLAAARMASERPGQTLDATGLVHEAYLRLVDVKTPQQWDNRGHFFAAAAESMRRILVDNARRKGRLKHGGKLKRVDLEEADFGSKASPAEMLDIDEAISKLATEDPNAAKLVKLRFFAGLSIGETAELLGLSRSTAYELWGYARAWLQCELQAMRDPA